MSGHDQGQSVKHEGHEGHEGEDTADLRLQPFVPFVVRAFAVAWL